MGKAEELKELLHEDNKNLHEIVKKLTQENKELKETLKVIMAMDKDFEEANLNLFGGYFFKGRLLKEINELKAHDKVIKELKEKLKDQHNDAAIIYARYDRRVEELKTINKRLIHTIEETVLGLDNEETVLGLDNNEDESLLKLIKNQTLTIDVSDKIKKLIENAVEYLK